MLHPGGGLRRRQVARRLRDRSVTKVTGAAAPTASLSREAMEAATTTAPRPATRAPERRLPPTPPRGPPPGAPGRGLPQTPPLPKPIQTAIWSRQARRMLYACQDRYG